jgi:hypothetical protein
VRKATIDLIDAIALWQETFTKPLRPRLLECDYIIDRMITHIDFVNATALRKMFNFQIFRGNILLLPFPNLFANIPVKVPLATAIQIEQFASPPENVIVRCYQFLINCLPEAVYKKQLVSLEKVPSHLLFLLSCAAVVPSAAITTTSLSLIHFHCCICAFSG